VTKSTLGKVSNYATALRRSWRAELLEANITACDAKHRIMSHRPSYYTP